MDDSLLKRIVFFRIRNSTLLLVALVWALFLAMPFWIDGGDSSIGNTDDVHAISSNYAALRTSHESINWTRTVVGGSDYHIFVGNSLLSLTRLYAAVLEPWQMFTFITVVNVILVFMFTWKIQVELLGISSVSAFCSSVGLSVVQGYWAGKWPDSHLSYGHSLAAIPAIIYVIHRYFNSRYIYVAVVGIAAGYSAGMPMILHILPAALIAMLLWLLFFCTEKVGRSIVMVVIFFVTVLLFHIEYLIAVVQLFPESARSGVSVERTVGLPLGHLHVYFYGFVAVFVAALSAFAFLLSRDKEIIRHLGLFVTGVVLVPLVAYILQETVGVSYRWHLLYIGNHFIYVVPLCFLLDRSVAVLYIRSRFMALWSAACIVIGVASTLSVIVLNSILMDFANSYQPGGWNYLRRNELVDKLMADETELFRILSYGVSPDIRFVGWHQGIEDAHGYHNLIDRKKVDFWQHMVPSYVRGFRSLDITESQERDLSGIKIELLRLMNVKYVLSRVPVNDSNLELYLARHPGRDYCHKTVPFLRDVFHGLPAFWRQISCLRQNRSFVRPLYIYKLRDYFPRVYMAGQVRVRRSGLEFTGPDYLRFVGEGNAVITREARQSGVDENVGLSRTGKIRISSYEQDQITVEVNASAAGFVVISDHNNAYWKLIVNGKPGVYYTVNLVQTGFFVDKGLTRAGFVYCPPFRLRLHKLCP